MARGLAPPRDAVLCMLWPRRLTTALPWSAGLFSWPLPRAGGPVVSRPVEVSELARRIAAVWVPERVAGPRSGFLLRSGPYVLIQRPAGWCGGILMVHIHREREEKNRSDITPDPGGHRPQRPCAQGRTCAKQDQAQASAPGRNRTQFVGGATTHGRRTRQAGKSVPVPEGIRQWPPGLPYAHAYIRGARRLQCVMHVSVPRMCYTQKATEAWPHQERQKHNSTKNSYDQPKPPSAGITYRIQPDRNAIVCGCAAVPCTCSTCMWHMCRRKWGCKW